MIAWAIALLVSFAPPDSPPPTQPPIGEEDLSREIEGEPAPDAGAPGVWPDTESPPAMEPGKLVLAPEIAGRYRIVGRDTQVDALVSAGPEQPAVAELPAGVYELRDDTDEVVSVLVVVAGRTQVWDGEVTLPIEVWAQRVGADTSRQVQVASPPPYQHRHNWRAWASPLSSAFVPGLGQFINGQPGKATAVLFGSVVATVGSSALYNLGHYGQRSNPAEYARLVGYGIFSTAAPLLWVYAVADAYRIATGKTVNSKLDHQVRLSVTRSMTVGFRADPSRPGFYDDWSVAIMGQVVPRLTIGLSDLGIKFGGPAGPQIWQFGARIDYRVYERPRLWINVGLGAAMQVASGRGPRLLDPRAALPPDQVRFGATPYAFFDLRWFLLDRLSLDFTPRLSVPVTTRYFSFNRALPRFAPILEFGAGISVYF